MILLTRFISGVKILVTLLAILSVAPAFAKSPDIPKNFCCIGNSELLPKQCFVRDMAPDNCSCQWERLADENVLTMQWSSALVQRKCLYAFSFSRQMDSDAIVPIDLSGISAITLKMSTPSEVPVKLTLALGSETGRSSQSFTLPAHSEMVTITLPIHGFSPIAHGDNFGLSTIYTEYLRKGTGLGSRSETQTPPSGVNLSAVTGFMFICEEPNGTGGSVSLAGMSFPVADDMFTLPRLADYDYIKLRKGDMVRGELCCDTFSITTALGRFDIPSENVVGAVLRGSSGAILALKDGQIFNGLLHDKTIALRLTINEMAQTRLKSISSFAFRISPQRPLFTKPKWPYLVTNGSRVVFEPESGIQITLQTPHGLVEIPFDSICQLTKWPDTTAKQWLVELDNGSRIIGRLQTEQLNATFSISEQVKKEVSLPTSALEVIAGPSIVTRQDESIEIRLVDSSVIYARPGNTTLAVKTTNGAMELDYHDIVSLEMDPVDMGLARITLWSGHELFGRLMDSTIPILLSPANITLDVLTSQISGINLSNYLAPKILEAKVDDLTQVLSSSDSPQSDSAYRVLLKIGPKTNDILHNKLENADPDLARKLRRILDYYKNTENAK